jgi:hypothetical protein
VKERDHLGDRGLDGRIKLKQISGIELGYGLDDRGFESRQGLGIFLFITTSRPTLEAN